MSNEYNKKRQFSPTSSNKNPNAKASPVPKKAKHNDSCEFEFNDSDDESLSQVAASYTRNQPVSNQPQASVSRVNGGNNPISPHKPINGHKPPKTEKTRKTRLDKIESNENEYKPLNLNFRNQNRAQTGAKSSLTYLDSQSQGPSIIEDTLPGATNHLTVNSNISINQESSQKRELRQQHYENKFKSIVEDYENLNKLVAGGEKANKINQPTDEDEADFNASGSKQGSQQQTDDCDEKLYNMINELETLFADHAGIQQIKQDLEPLRAILGFSPQPNVN